MSACVALNDIRQPVSMEAVLSLGDNDTTLNQEVWSALSSAERYVLGLAALSIEPDPPISSTDQPITSRPMRS